MHLNVVGAGIKSTHPRAKHEDIKPLCFSTQKKTHNPFRVAENSIELCFAAYIFIIILFIRILNFDWSIYLQITIEIINNTRGGIVMFFTEKKRERVYWGASSSPGCRARR